MTSLVESSPGMSEPAEAPSTKRRLPLFQGLLPIVKAKIPTDLIAGVTLAALAIPEVMGYTSIAGMPVITGLYTILLPVFAFAILGSSRHLVVGADSATAAVMAAGLAGLATAQSDQYVALAGLLALMAGAFLIIARLIKLGFLADFLSRTVLIGFLTGVGIQVACGQVGGMLGIPEGTGVTINGRVFDNTIGKLISTLQNLDEISWTTAAVSAGVLGTILGLKMITGKIPGALIAVIGATFISWKWDLADHGVATLGPLQSGLPSIGLPDVTWSDIPPLLGTAVSIFVLVLAQSAATSRAYAAKYNDRFDENVDLVGLSAASVAAGLSGTFVVNGSPTKTQMVDGAGGTSQIAQLGTGVIVAIVLLFLTVPIQYMPEAVLASVVFLIGIELVDLPGMRRVLRLRRRDAGRCDGRPRRRRAGNHPRHRRIGHRSPPPLVPPQHRCAPRRRRRPLARCGGGTGDTHCARPGRVPLRWKPLLRQRQHVLRTGQRLRQHRRPADLVVSGVGSHSRHRLHRWGNHSTAAR
jgi:SulP family sulfate permease